MQQSVKDGLRLITGETEDDVLVTAEKPHSMKVRNCDWPLLESTTPCRYKGVNRSDLDGRDMPEINTCSIGIRTQATGDDLYVCENCLTENDLIFENLPIDKENQDLCGQCGGPLYLPFRRD